MSPAQQARTEGFLVSLLWRGVPVFLQPSGQAFTALIEPVAPDPGQFALAREEATAARIHILREHLAGTIAIKGSVFRDAGGTRSFRVTAVEDDPASVSIIFIVEIATVP